MSFTSITSDTLSPTSSVKEVSLGTSSKGSHRSEEERRKSSHVRLSENRESVQRQKRRYSILQEPIRKATLEEYQREQLKEQPLFSDVLILDDATGDVQLEKTSIEQSILVTGFGIRNLESLQNALQEEENKRLNELYKYQAEESRTSITSSSETVTKSIETETEIPSVKSDISVQKQKIEYLMGLETAEEEEATAKEVEKEKQEEEEEEQFVFSSSVSMRIAQKYLRTHRIFDFFQFIIAHLLSALPENPISFILLLLSKCLTYRSGLGKPPLLYEEKHIEELFGLMDRMKTGYIELDQYKKGMATLGISEFNKNPPLSQDNMVAKEVFIQEALENETAIFEDLIKRKWIGKKPTPEPNYSDGGSSCHSLVGPYFIPSDLLQDYRRRDGMPKVDEEGAEGEGSTAIVSK